MACYDDFHTTLWHPAHSPFFSLLAHRICFQGEQMGTLLDRLGLPVEQNAVSLTAKLSLYTLPSVALTPHLSQKLVFPVLQMLKALDLSDVMNQNTTVSTSVERYSQRLKSFLPSCVPNLYNNAKVIFKTCLTSWTGKLNTLHAQSQGLP
jgi:hypothetical protein